ncbi:hypothetical protein EXIGLDRAFT_603211 [Exidia glandulosa HHB12029]|uniref:Protein kinase domain-containing protein n=1 Tax=Exidia glandulosa HHB12029 TaxID=1314781 RepID=A0A165NUU0_EXIGL|nr:hypothetical protein EXIGLDRAFT_603211 [Exidia glandulosa HHB12029]
MQSELLPFELPWVHLQPFLREHGYELRARYQPDWQPSWIRMEEPSLRRKYEDGSFFTYDNILDATRASDGKAVILKLIEREDLSEQHMRYLNGDGRCEDIRNHTVPLLDVLRPPLLPSCTIIVTPRLVPWDNWPFTRVSEVVDFVHQILAGLAFMHELHLVHLDASVANIMMDGLHLYLEPDHPARPGRALNDFRSVRRLERHESPAPVKYYYIDFGQSVRFQSLEDRRPLRRPGAQDRTVPEERYPDPCDPFALDVYCVGNVIKEYILEVRVRPAGTVYWNVRFLRRLVQDMVGENPSSRPTAAEALARFAAICETLKEDDLRKPLRRLWPIYSDIIKVLNERALDRAEKRVEKKLRTAATPSSQHTFLDTLMRRTAQRRRDDSSPPEKISG